MDPPTLSPKQTAILFIETGVAKHNLRLDILFFKAFLAGVYLSFGGLLYVVSAGGSAGLTASNPGLVKIISGFVFPVGLTMIVLTGQELLTSDMFIFIMTSMKRRTPWWGLPYNWLVVFFGNLAGALFFGAILVHYSGVISDDPYRTYIQNFIQTKARKPEWHQIFLRGIACNWLVCIAVWQAAAAADTVSKIYGLWIPIWVFVACSFDHVVANMFSIPVGIMLGGDMTVAYYIRKSLIPSFLGNVVGAAFVAVPAVWFFLKEEREGDIEDRGMSRVEYNRAAENLSPQGTGQGDEKNKMSNGDVNNISSKVA